MIERPTSVRDEHLTYLDDLRESGVTNMFGAAVYLERSHSELNPREAQEILVYWMESFSERLEAGEVVT